MESKPDYIAILNDLIKTCFDGAAGFQAAADGVGRDDFKALFLDLSRQRQQLAGELQAEVPRLGSDPGDRGSAGGAAHRGWMNVKAAITGRDDAAILAECERGEEIAVEEYEKALQTQFPENIAQMIRRQYATVQATHDRIRELEKTQQDAAH